MMEDDSRKMESDRYKVEGAAKKHKEGGKIAMDPGSPDYVRNQTEVVPTTPTPRLVRKVGHPAMVPRRKTMLRDMVDMSPIEPRADSLHGMTDTDYRKENIKLRQTTIQTVRMNYMDIRDIKKTKKECDTPKQDYKKTKKPSRSSTPGRNTPSSNKITQYLTVFEPDNVKKTFSSIETKKNVSQKINMFQGLGGVRNVSRGVADVQLTIADWLDR